MVVIVLQDLSKKFVLGVMDGFDDVFIIAGEIEEAATFARRTELGKYVFAGQRYEIVGRIQLECRSQMAENPGGVVFELEIILC